ncbi:NfeD family protein [Sphingomonas tabacisoli]|uniref:NfeD family protein n=1 Tax=Sphingomonas tabacisoli TaxID=2249466 RepID=A0ABW4I342_9SPHN
MNVDSYWYWLIVAAGLAAAELLVPGVFLVWVALAAAITGLVTLAIEPPLAVQLLIFAGAAVATTLAGRRWYSVNHIPSADPLLNDRAGRLVGETVELTKAIVNGRGRARVGDSEWNVRGPDAPLGACMRVVGTEDGALVVRPVSALSSSE